MPHHLRVTSRQLEMSKAALLILDREHHIAMAACSLVIVTVISTIGLLLGQVPDAPVVSDSTLLSWCLAGSAAAALASICLWPPAIANGTAACIRGMVLMFISNFLVGSIFGPALVGYLEENHGLKCSLANSIAVSGSIALATTLLLRRLGIIIANSVVKAVESINVLAVVLKFFRIQMSPEIQEQRLAAIKTDLEKVAKPVPAPPAGNNDTQSLI